MITSAPPRVLSLNRYRSRHLFEWDARDYSLNARTRQAQTYTRDLPAWDTSTDGRIYRVAPECPRFTTIGSMAGMTLEPPSVNLVLQSENFGVTWGIVGTPTRVAAAHTASGVTLDLLGDDDAASSEGYVQAVSYTGDTNKAFSVFLRKGSSTGVRFFVWDNTAGVARLSATMSWNGMVPSPAMGVGTYLGYIAYADDVYRLLFSSDVVIATNSNAVYVYPAVTGGVGATGTAYVGGVQTENCVYPTTYMKTTTATVTRNADALIYTAECALQDLTVYCKIARPVHADVAGTLIGYPTPFRYGSGLGIYFSKFTRSIYAQIKDNGGGYVTTATYAIPADPAIELAAQFADLATAPRVRLDIGSGWGAWASPGAVSVPTLQYIYLGGAGNDVLSGVLSVAKMTAGLFDMAQMREN